MFYIHLFVIYHLSAYLLFIIYVYPFTSKEKSWSISKMNSSKKTEFTPRKALPFIPLHSKYKVLQNSYYSLTVPKGWQMFVQEMNGWMNEWRKYFLTKGSFKVRLLITVTFSVFFNLVFPGLSKIIEFCGGYFQ